MGKNNPYRKMEKIHSGQVDAYKGQLSSLNSWYNNNANRDFLSTSMGKSMSSLISDQADKQTNRMEGNAAVMGATEASKLAQSSNINSGVAEGINKLTQYGTQYNDNIRNNYFSKMMSLQGKIGEHQLGGQQVRAQRRQQNFDNTMAVVGAGTKVAGMFIEP